MAAYYNENDAFAAEWLRKLIKRKLIADGDVDDRSILDVDAEDLKGYQQHHFFAGIGGWSLAARMAGWNDEDTLCTGSPPCQPFSLIGKYFGVNDERHLTPKWLELVATIRPAFIAGEQVGIAVTKDYWLDDLLDEMEAQGYATGAIVLPACGIGAPHIRQRLFFCGERMDDTKQPGLERHTGNGSAVGEQGRKHPQQAGHASTSSSIHHQSTSMDEVSGLRRMVVHDTQEARSRVPMPACGALEDISVQCWNGTEYVACAEGWRPVKRGINPLADGLPTRMGLRRGRPPRTELLKGYGNAIVPQLGAYVLCALKHHNIGE